MWHQHNLSCIMYRVGRHWDETTDELSVNSSEHELEVATVSDAEPAAAAGGDGIQPWLSVQVPVCRGEEQGVDADAGTKSLSGEMLAKVKERGLELMGLSRATADEAEVGIAGQFGECEEWRPSTTENDSGGPSPGRGNQSDEVLPVKISDIREEVASPSDAIAETSVVGQLNESKEWKPSTTENDSEGPSPDDWYKLTEELTVKSSELGEEAASVLDAIAEASVAKQLSESEEWKPTGAAETTDSTGSAVSQQDEVLSPNCSDNGLEVTTVSHAIAAPAAGVDDDDDRAAPAFSDKRSVDAEAVMHSTVEADEAPVNSRESVLERTAQPDADVDSSIAGQLNEMQQPDTSQKKVHGGSEPADGIMRLLPSDNASTTTASRIHCPSPAVTLAVHREVLEAGPGDTKLARAVDVDDVELIDVTVAPLMLQQHGDIDSTRVISSLQHDTNTASPVCFQVCTNVAWRSW